MSKPVYEIPVTGDDTGRPLVPPPLPPARPMSYTTAPPPSSAGPDAAWPPYSSAMPEIPFSSPLPTEPPPGGWSTPPAEASFPPPTANAIQAGQPFTAPMPDGAWAAPSAPMPTPEVNFPAPSSDQNYPAVPGITYPPAGMAELAFPAPAAPAAVELNFPAPAAPVVSYAEQMFESDGVSETLATADPDLIAALSEVVRIGASDLHVAINAAPMLRVDGVLAPASVKEPWGREKVDAAIRSLLTEEQQAIFDRTLEFDFAYTISAKARFRVNIYQQRGALGAAFRLIPTEIKSLVELGVPETVSQFATLPRGLVLVTGPTGSGKSTTLAALIDLVNKTRADHIMTVEDPIEFLHGNQKSLINQREVGHDTHSFASALKHVLRQDPDVILIGELRDLETISVALTAAETGHLVFATLHTQDAPQTIDRIIDVFEPHQQGQVRAQLAATLQGVVCQTLVKRASGKGRVVATEIMVTTPAVANLIREGKTYQIPTAMQAGRGLGMHTMDQHLADMVNSGIITHGAALEKVHDVEGFKTLVHRTESTAGMAQQGLEFATEFGAR
jgi:twitching motility protein PilT